MSDYLEIDCFGFYLGGPTCNNCSASKRCRAILITHGFDIMAAYAEQLLAALPEGLILVDTDKVSEMVNTMFEPEKNTAAIAKYRLKAGLSDDPELAQLLDTF